MAHPLSARETLVRLACLENQAPGPARGFLLPSVDRQASNQGGKCGVGQLVICNPADDSVQMTSPGPSHQPAGRGAFKIKCEMKLPWMDPRLRELVALAVLAALGCGLALSQGDLLFAAIFAAACAATIIEAIRRSR
jgi:hypothetical protein